MAVDDEVRDLLESLDDQLLLDVYREFDSWSGADSIEDSDGFNEVLGSMEPLEVATWVWRSNNFNPFSEYFMFPGGWDVIECFDSLSDVADFIKSTWIDEMVDFVIGYPDDVDIPGLDSILEGE